MNSQASATCSRRTFLHSFTVLAAAGMTGCLHSVRSPKVTVGAHPWVYAATQPNYDITPVLPRIFEDMSFAGMECIELMHTALRPPDAVDRIRSLSARHHLPVIGASFGGAMWDRTQHQAILNDARVVIPRLQQAGGRTLGVSVGAVKWGSPVRKTAAQLDAQAELLRELIALCQQHGITLNLHNHTYEVENDLHDLKGTLERLPGTPLGPDLNWLVRGGVDPIWFIREYGRQIVFLHLRDQGKDGRWSEALGEGDMDYSAIAAALREIGFRGDAIIELAHEKDFQPARPLRESLRLSRAFVRTTFGW